MVTNGGFMDYSHNGAMSGIGVIQVTIHINPSASPSTMTPGTLPAFTFRGTSSCS